MKQPPQTLLEADGISIAYGPRPVVRGVTLAIRPRSFTGLIGPNGAGKTTLLLSLSGQFRPVAGEIRFRGADVYADNLSFKRRIGVVSENPYFPPHLAAVEFLHFVARVKGLDGNRAEKAARSALETVMLEGERDKPCAALSMGMRKKLAIAAALIGRPEILFLDEALNGIDIESAYRIKKELKGFKARGGAVVLSSHVLETLEKLCDRYVVMDGGEVLADWKAARSRAAAKAPRADLETAILRLLKRRATARDQWAVHRNPGRNPEFH